MSTLFGAFEDFILSREAMLCSSVTINLCRRMLERFLAAANRNPTANPKIGDRLR